MQRFLLVPLFALSVLVGGGILLGIANEAVAACCMCGSCPRGATCTCPGKSAQCPFCTAPDNSILTAVRETLSPIVADAVNTDRLIRLAGDRQCPQNNLRLKLLETENIPKVEPQLFRNNTTQDVVAFQSNAGNDK